MYSIFHTLFREGYLISKDKHEEAIKKERERCAKIAESYSGRAYSRRQILKPSTIANAIRKELS